MEELTASFMSFLVTQCTCVQHTPGAVSCIRVCISVYTRV